MTEICSGVFNEVNTMNAKGERNTSRRTSVKPVTITVLVIFLVLGEQCRCHGILLMTDFSPA